MRIHLIAIGGAVMHNLALELQHRGHIVSGSDDHIFSPAKERLAKAQLLPEYEGWFPDKLSTDIDLVILGMHAKASNPELIKAQELGLKISSFPAFIASQSENKKRVVIAGSHGKTTTTAMVMHCLKTMHIDTDYLVGSQLAGFERMVKLTDAPIIVIEGDEYLSSAIDMYPKFLCYKPHVAVITGIAWDHINVFPTYQNYVSQFSLFTQNLAPDAKLFAHRSIQNEKYFDSAVDVQYYDAFAFEETAENSVIHYENKSYPMQVFGKFNFENMKAACNLCNYLEISTTDFLQSMTTFGGTAKRQEKIVESDTFLVLRDFAHSPSKVKAAVEAVCNKYKDYHCVCVLELHTFSSLNEAFIPFYQDSLKPADSSAVYIDAQALILKDKQFPPLELLSKTFPQSVICKHKLELEEFIKKSLHASQKTVFLFMSSGNFGGVDLNQFKQ
jgi:UDP-N-acetylmuramate: L-alanyl-gamma-D-glutamyl-meso-diaminopimelate ligase